MHSDEDIRQIILEIQSESEYLRDKATKELHSTSDSRFVSIALAMLDEEDYDPVRAAIVTLRNLLNFNPPQFLPRVCQFLDVPSHCATAIWFIWSVGDASYVPRLIRFLSDPDYWIRFEALKTIGRYGHPDLLEMAIYMRKDEYSGTRSIASGLIARYPHDSRCFDILISMLHDEGEAVGETVGSRIAIRLGEIGDSCAVQPLVEGLRFGHERLAFRALFALRDMKVSILESLCLEQLRNRHEKVRREIMYILSQSPKVEFTDALISVVQTDSSEVVKSYAIRALRNIGTPKAVTVANEWLEQQKRNS